MNPNFDNILERLKASAPEDAFSGPVSQATIDAAEIELGVQFPSSFKGFLREFGSADWPETVAGLGKDLPPDQLVVKLTLTERHARVPNMCRMLVAFSPDGRGNHHCFDTSNMVDEECPVVIWNHDKSENQVLQIIHPGFQEWLNELIDWAIESDLEDS